METQAFLLHALDAALDAGPDGSLLFRLVHTHAEAQRAMSDAALREKLAAPLREYIAQMPDSLAARLIETAQVNPGAIHALHELMQPEELLATAIFFLQRGIATPDRYTPSAPHVLSVRG